MRCKAILCGMVFLLAMLMIAVVAGGCTGFALTDRGQAALNTTTAESKVLTELCGKGEVESKVLTELCGKGEVESCKQALARQVAFLEALNDPNSKYYQWYADQDYKTETLKDWIVLKDSLDKCADDPQFCDDCLKGHVILLELQKAAAGKSD